MPQDTCIGRYYTVVTTIGNALLRDHLRHGYEFEEDFRHALRNLVNRWRGRVGECVEERNGFRRLRFHDTPGGRPDEEWLPAYLLQEVTDPPYTAKPAATPQDELEQELDRAFGFD
jgi:hypothetical protein